MFCWIYSLVILVILKDHVVQSADTVYMERIIRDVLSNTRNHRTNMMYKNKAMWFIHNEFKQFGLTTEFHNFEFLGINFTNIIGIRRGKNFGTQHDKITGVCAHYDTMPNTTGVDDNGSGVAAMLEVARQLFTRKLDTDHTLIFLSPDMEEYGLVGSDRFVAQWIPAWFQKYYTDVRFDLKPNGMIVLDSVMNFNTTSNSQMFSGQLEFVFPETFASIASDQFQGDFMTVIYRNTSDVQLAQSFKNAWIQTNRERFEIEEFRLPFSRLTRTVKAQFRDFFRSDHYHFWLADIPAIFLSDTANFRGDMIGCYHNPCDNTDVMLTDDNLAFLGKTADAIVSTILHLTGLQL